MPHITHGLCVLRCSILSQPGENKTKFPCHLLPVFHYNQMLVPYVSFYSFLLALSATSRLHETSPSHISSFFSLKGKRQYITERGKTVRTALHTVVFPLSTLFSGHFSLYHQSQPLINIQGLCYLSRSSSCLSSGKHQKDEGQEEACSQLGACKSLSAPQPPLDKWT